MRILYLCSDAGIPILGRKGASVHVRELVRALAQVGNQVTVAAPVLTKSAWETPAEIEATIVQIPPGTDTLAAASALRDYTDNLGTETTLAGEMRRVLYNQEFAAQLIRRFEKDPPDFVYERAALYGTAGVTVARALGVPHLLELNAPLSVEQAAYRGHGLTALAAEAERFTLSRAHAVLTVSDCLRGHATALGADAARVHVVPNGVNAALFRPGVPDDGLRKRWGIGDGPVLGFVGGLRPWHGVEVLPELVAALAPKYPGLRLVLVGDGPLRGELERRLAAEGIAERAIFCGALPHEEIPGVMRLFDLALAPYPLLDHPFYFSPLKLFEYMGCGIATVAADCGQISQIVRSGVTGWLYPAGDLSALIASCQDLLAQPKLRRQLGRAAAEHIEQNHTWAHNARRVVALAEECRRAADSAS